MGKSARMAKANPNKPGDFFYKAGDGAPVSDIAGKPTIWMDPDPMVDLPSARAMFLYVFLTLVGMILTYFAIRVDTYLSANSGAYAGLDTLFDEAEKTVPLEGSWAVGGEIMRGMSVFSFILSGLGVLIMCCNMADYNHRFVQMGTILAYLTALFLIIGLACYEAMSKEDRYDPKYDTQIGPYKIHRTWIWGSSYLCTLANAFISVCAAICAFCSTMEALKCEQDPWGTCKTCFTCAQDAHKVSPYEKPILPSEGGHMMGSDGSSLIGKGSVNDPDAATRGQGATS